MNKASRSLGMKMSFLECRKLCISNSLDDKKVSEIYQTLSIPSQKVWLECLKEVMCEPSEDVNNPFNVMGRYELRLHKLGIPTVLSKDINRIKFELTQIASKNGIPGHFLKNIINLGVETHFRESSKH